MKGILFSLLLMPVFGVGQELKGNYIGSYESASTKSKYELWEASLDYFSKNNFTIKSHDKEAGMLVVESPDLFPKYSYEKEGKLKDTTAYVALDKIRALDPKAIKLTLNIRVSENKIVCSASSVDVTTDKSKRFKWRTYPGAKSTGNYEKMVVEGIKNS